LIDLWRYMHIKEYLKKNKMTLGDFTKQIGIRYGTFACYVLGDRRMPIEVADRVIDHTNGQVTLKDLVGLQRDKSRHEMIA
jgi:hypothetical protein